ncbi:MAG TPA: 30S ribosomal protein S4 [Candidatus Paceibacterota bacterium]|jgi:small subunit ribosomal protein S4|nr:30S ribosomal protein S4 [Candidatus Paceibacterota bacterium]
MKVGPKYKIARRLGAAVFEKTQTSKYAASESKRGAVRTQRRGGAKSDFGLQMLEKQKARYSYLVTEKQFANYVKAALASKGTENVPTLFKLLESRLDNVVLRSGLAHTRPLARQLVSHGHIMVNGRRVTIPSFQVKMGDVVSIRPGSRSSKVFSALDERLKAISIPAWLKLDADKGEVTVQGAPQMQNANLLFDLNAVFEFYSR